MKAILYLLFSGTHSQSCSDTLEDGKCETLKYMCVHFYYANYQCPQTCGKCGDKGLDK